MTKGCFTMTTTEFRGAAAAPPRPRRAAWWRLPFTADTWRRTLYLLLAAPASIVSVPLALLGGHQAAARMQRQLARRYLGLRIEEPGAGRTAGRTIAHALVSLPLSLGSLALAAYLWVLVPMNLAYPLRPGTMDSYQDSWGGPTLAGAWAVHAAGGLAALFLAPWIIRGITAVQGRFAAPARRRLMPARRRLMREGTRHADTLAVVSAGSGSSGEAAAWRAGRAAVSRLRLLSSDLSPFAPVAPAPLSRRWRWSLAAGAVVVFGLGTLDLTQHYRLSPGASLALSAARALPLLVCLDRPIAGWWLELAASLATALVAHPVSSSEPWPWPVTSVLAQVVVLVMVGLRSPRRVLVELWVLLALAGGVAWLAAPYRRQWQTLTIMAVFSAAALLLGDAMRGRNETRRRLVEQERISEEERARRVLLEERARIARELHDVVAHHMSLIAIQAEAAPYRVADPPRELTASFASIRESALQGLAELRRVLGVLRAEHSVDETTPQPMLDGLDALVAGVRGAGLTVETVVSGTPRPLPPGVELSAYRIVQEALSNAMRHAPGSDVRVELAFAPGELDVRVVNGPPGAAPSGPRGPGHGVLGMRERAAMLGGGLTVGPTPQGGYAVAAVLPLPRGADQ
jgi:signal transduction histidine kinase